MPEGSAADLAVRIHHDLAVEIALPEASDSRRIPRGQTGQLQLLQRQLDWCTKAIQVQQRKTGTAMRNEDMDQPARWDAVRALRELAWKVCAEVLPLVGRVPAGLRSHHAFLEVERSAHILRRTTEDALRDNANYTVDLVSASADSRSW